MNFSSDIFIFLFLPSCVCIFFLVAPRLRIVVVLGFSLLFYGASGMLPLLLLVASSVWAYFIAPQIQKRKWVAWFAVVPPLAALYLFKYLDFSLTLTGAEDVRSSLYFILSISMPAGISFYTFQIIGYLIDVYDGRLKPEKNLLQFCAFISFFPQLIAGPILRYDQICSQLERLDQKGKIPADFSSGAKFISYGLFAKIFFADILLTIQQKVVKAEQAIHLQDNLFSIFSYSFVIYYDFWAYSLIAIGLGQFMSINLPRNFHEPYLSTSPKEFWRRWHTTLSFWLRDYVYLRLGGNRCYIRNILIVFFAVGVWHGAGLNFMAWGIYHSLWVIVYHLTRPAWDAMWKPLQIAITFVIVSFGWPLFYLDIMGYFSLMGNLLDWNLDAPAIVNASKWGLLGMIALWTFSMRENRWLFNHEKHWFFDSPYLWAALAFIAVLFFSYGRTFIYFVF
ncbi:MAG: MBOAT family protein [Candidatus Nitrohelix vancouverensis]|uniref:MBOAT family protein n=1 Tax=Candidatus Nitrohelix vancouverensis TaxID=2705534 RepID=A0A7T0C026_9BACT|nr:MAG: MBOAT family protein [Candidatus Nitrohelix vancouverensis]